MQPRPLFIYGAGGLGREILWLVRQINQQCEQWDVKGFLDDGLASGTLVNGLRVAGDSRCLLEVDTPVAIVLAVGNPKIKRQIAKRLLDLNVYFPALVHPGAELPSVMRQCLAAGTILCAGTVLTVNIRMGMHVLVNLNCTIGHDAYLENYCSLMPGVHLSGNSTLEEAVYIGTGAVVLNGVAIGREAVIGAGATVIRDIPAHCTAVGVPARPVKFSIPGQAYMHLA